jgi:hypothetical protein
MGQHKKNMHDVGMHDLGLRSASLRSAGVSITGMHCMVIHSANIPDLLVLKQYCSLLGKKRYKETLQINLKGKV